MIVLSKEQIVALHNALVAETGSLKTIRLSMGTNA